jgi:hypothetical protein
MSKLNLTGPGINTSPLTIRTSGRTAASFAKYQAQRMIEDHRPGR